MRTWLLGLAACLLGLTLSGTVRACHWGYGGCGRGWCGGYGGYYGGGYGWSGGGYGGYYGGGYGGYSPGWYGGMIGYAAPSVVTNTTLVRTADVGANTTQKAPATLVVHLPADATLLAQGVVLKSTAGTRTFVSPPLQRGATYSYTLEARMKNGDKTMVSRKKVTVRAGQTTEALLRFPTAQVAIR